MSTDNSMVYLHLPALCSKNKDPNGQGPEQLIEEKEGGMNMNRPEGCLNRERTKDVFRKITEPNFVLEAALARQELFIVSRVKVSLLTCC